MPHLNRTNCLATSNTRRRPAAVCDDRRLCNVASHCVQQHVVVPGAAGVVRDVDVRLAIVHQLRERVIAATQNPSLTRRPRPVVFGASNMAGVPLSWANTQYV